MVRDYPERLASEAAIAPVDEHRFAVVNTYRVSMPYSAKPHCLDTVLEKGAGHSGLVHTLAGWAIERIGSRQEALGSLVRINLERAGNHGEPVSVPILSLLPVVTLW